MELEKFFKKIDRKMIDDFLSNNQEEHLNLEFKTISKADFSDRNDRKNFAKSLSGFANSSGGVIIWGVEAKQNQQGIDCASTLKEIQPLPQLLSKLNEFSGQFVDPIIEGIKHKRIPASGNKGLAMTLVPESNAGPHMAKAGEDRYYKRSGSSFYKMEHFDIQDMFGRRKKPKLSLKTDIPQASRESGSGGTFYKCRIIVSIENSGPGIAKYISLSLSVNSPYAIGQYNLDDRGRFGLLRLPSAGPWQVRFLGDANIVVHSKSFLEITIIKRKIRADSTSIEDLEIEFEIKAEEMMLVNDKKTITGAEILSKVLPQAGEND